MAVVFEMKSLQLIAMLFTALNGFNRCVHADVVAAACCNWFCLDGSGIWKLFQAITGLLLALMGFTAGAWILGAVGILMLIGSGHVWHQYRGP